MAPLDPQYMFQKLRIDTSTSSSPGTSASPTPLIAHRSRSAERSTRATDWQYDWDCPDPAAIQRQKRNQSWITSPSNARDVADTWSCAPTSHTPETQHAHYDERLPESVADDVEPRDGSASPSRPVLRARQTSVSFNPKVRLNTGHERGLGERISDRWSPPTRPRGRSLLQEISQGQPLTSPAAVTTRSHVERVRPSGVSTGSPSRPARSMRIAQTHFPLLRSSLDASGGSPLIEGQDSVASLTSESTSSPSIEEAATPPETPIDFTLSPQSATSSLPQPTSLNHSAGYNGIGSWPVPHRRTSVQRSKSYAIDPAKGSQRTRQTPIRCSSASMSPAGAFLSSWGAVSAAAAPEADDEGQEIGNYVLGRQIGFGGFSIVREARTIEADREVKRAVKIVRKHILGKADRENEQAQSEFEHEVSLWRFLQHANVLPLIAVYNTPFATFCFTELHSNGSLFDLVRGNRKGLPLHLAKRYAYQLASALRYLHEDAHIVHRDIKLENCLLDMSDPAAAALGGTLLLCDFGMAEFLNGGRDADDDEDDDDEGDNEDQRIDSDGNGSDLHSDASSSPFTDLEEDRPPAKTLGPSDTSTSLVGSLQYASPELLKSETPLFSKAADIWAYGVVLYALFVGELPFQHTLQPRVPLMILNGDWSRDALAASVGLQEDLAGRDAVELVKGCLTMDAAGRWTVGHVLHCIWLEECNEVYDADLAAGWEL